MGHLRTRSSPGSLECVQEDTQVALEVERSLEVICDEKDPGLVGAIEVECVEGEAMQLIDRIRLLPQEARLILFERADSMCSLGDLDQDQGVEITGGLLEQLTNAFMEGCSCDMADMGPPCKSLLRPPKRGRGEIPSNVGRAVSFSNLDIREFNVTLGDHPNSTSGPPVAIDWDSASAQRVVALDDYERTRDPRRKRRQMKLSYTDRKGILEQQRGFSREEVNSAWAEALKIRQQRKETLARGPLMMMWDEFSESSQRKLLRAAQAVGLPIT